MTTFTFYVHLRIGLDLRQVGRPVNNYTRKREDHQHLVNRNEGERRKNRWYSRYNLWSRCVFKVGGQLILERVFTKSFKEGGVGASKAVETTSAINVPFCFASVVELDQLLNHSLNAVSPESNLDWRCTSELCRLSKFLAPKLYSTMVVQCICCFRTNWLHIFLCGGQLANWGKERDTWAAGGERKLILCSVIRLDQMCG